ncbi:carbohydrate porin [Acinetobacter tibetensis]|uniref:carbohydrate porin n=1 Tax=Acinetobacter tibetensis TaxID=2943497 RepID=UPI003A4DFC07
MQKLRISRGLLTLCLIGLSVNSWTYAQSAFAVDSPWMFGDWNGTRTELDTKGYRFNLGYTGEMATLLDAKKHSSHGTEYADQFVLGSHFDLDKILGWQDTEAQIIITERNGHSLSQTSDALNGHLSSTQEVWGRGQTWRLTNLWIKKQFINQKLDIKVGRFGEGEDFNSFDCDFQNLALCGSQVGNWVGDQWFNWPVSQWAARLKYQFSPEVFSQIGVYEYNPENLKRSQGFNLSTSGADGVIVPIEMVWQPKIGMQGKTGEYRLGYYYSSADAVEIQNPNETSHKQGMWVVAKQQLLQHAQDPQRGLTGFINLTVHDDKTNNVDTMQNIGLIYTGVLDIRPQDEIALGFARIHLNDDLNTGQDEEYNTELYYGVHATNWLTIRPNLQYIRHVGADKNGENVWVGGIKFQTAF